MLHFLTEIRMTILHHAVPTSQSTFVLYLNNYVLYYTALCLIEAHSSLNLAADVGFVVVLTKCAVVDLISEIGKYLNWKVKYLN